MPDYRNRFLSALLAQKQAQGKSLSQSDYLETCQVIAEIIEAETAERVRAECLAVKKQRKKANVHPGAEAIYKRYPNRQGGMAALLVISQCITEDGFETVLAQTTKYADATIRWSKDEKTKIPHATTWFNQRRYKLDDEAKWQSHEAPPPPPPKEQLPEPQGWRFSHPDSTFVKNNISWSAIDEATKKWIIEHTPKQQTA